ncbi:hypothetical protein HZB96_05140 [Candidatus Gottesmanbacteria bacterium]|nr:hypothetical protein [Candidatus Gottesmanbacteria bacterium]MBI5452036.1 hypothetical protein [Candidatus Gottesmanbacteria bacterium]
MSKSRFSFFTACLKRKPKMAGGENMAEDKQTKRQKQSLRRLKTSDVLEFIMSDVSHVAHTLDRILEAVSDKSASGKKESK